MDPFPRRQMKAAALGARRPRNATVTLPKLVFDQVQGVSKLPPRATLSIRGQICTLQTPAQPLEQAYFFAKSAGAAIVGHMPRYFFDIREGARFLPDEDGLELPDLDAAEREAAESAASIGRDLLPKGDARDVTIEVKNEHRQRVVTVTVSMHLDRVSPEPSPP